MDQTQTDMMAARDRHRLAVLRSFELDRETETAAFDEIVRLTARLMGKPAAFVSLVESDRQWFLAHQGMDVTQTGIERSICRHILNMPGVSVIEDTLRDGRTRINPLCLGADGVRFYAGAPLVTADGETLGALAVVDTEPGTLGVFQREVLAMLANQVMAQLSLRKALRRSEMMRREVDHRVKNSLQSVASLTRIQARAVASDEAREALEHVGRRINTVAALNQQIYSSETGRDVEMGAFLSEIATLLRDSLPQDVSLTLEAAEITLETRKAGAIAVVVNEFVTNSVKHAFRDGGGTVSISLARDDDGDVVLTCRDDGMGLSASAGATGGLGLAIMDSAIDQLNGVKTVLDGPGHGLRVICRG